MVEYKKLSELVDIHIGKTPSRANLNYWGGNEPWISISDMKQKYILTTKEYITQKAVQDTNIFLIPEGTLLMSFKLSIGKLGFTTKPMFSNEAIAALIIKDNTIINKNYLYYSIQNTDLTQNTDKAVKGLTLNKAKLKELKIACHPLEDQQRIVKILDKAEEIRTKKKLANEKLDEFLKSTFIDMFGDPVTNPNNYPIQALEDVTKFITDGKHGDCEDEIGSGYYFVSAKCINNGRIDLTQARQIKYSDYQDVNKRVKINLNDLLIVNTGATIGKMAIVRNPNVANCITLQKSVAVINIYNTKLLTEYLCYCLKCKSIANVSAGSAIRNLLLSTMRSYKLPIPPIAMQDKFSKIVQKVEAQKEKNQKVIEQMDNLFNSLMQQAFNSSL